MNRTTGAEATAASMALRVSVESRRAVSARRDGCARGEVLLRVDGRRRDERYRGLVLSLMLGEDRLIGYAILLTASVCLRTMLGI